MWKPRVFIFKWIGESRDREWPQRNTMKVSFSKCENNKRLWPKQRRTKVNNSLQELNIVYYSSKLCHNGILIYYVKTKVLWEKKNYGIIENTMLLWTKPRYCTWNYGTSIYEEKNMVDYQKTMKLWFIMEKLW